VRNIATDQKKKAPEKTPAELGGRGDNSRFRFTGRENTGRKRDESKAATATDTSAGGRQGRGSERRPWTSEVTGEIVDRGSVPKQKQRSPA